jgi:hypothetical protein
MGMEVADFLSLLSTLPHQGANRNALSFGILICTSFLFSSFCDFKRLLPLAGKSF